MIGIFDDDLTTRLGVTYNGLNINSVTSSSAGARSSRYGYTVEAVGSRTAMDYVSEPNQWSDMIELYGLRKTSRIIVVRGFVLGRNVSEVYDKAKALANATDPSLVKFQNPSDPFIALTFSTPTEDTANYLTGLAASKYNALPIRMAEPAFGSAQQGGLAVPYEINFILREPKRFLQTASTLSGAGTAANSKADDRSWPTLTFTLSGTGSATFTVQNVGTYQGTKSLVLNLSGYSSGNWTVNFRDRKILQGTTERPDVYVSGTFFEFEPGDNVITYSNTTNTSSRVLTWYPAFSL